MVATLVQPSQPQPVQSAAIWAASQANSPEVWNGLFSQWTNHTTVTRQEMLDQALCSTAGANALICRPRSRNLLGRRAPGEHEGGAGAVAG